MIINNSHHKENHQLLNLMHLLIEVTIKEIIIIINLGNQEIDLLKIINNNSHIKPDSKSNNIIIKTKGLISLDSIFKTDFNKIK